MTDVNILTAVGSFGIGGGIALYLVYWLTNHFGKQMDAHTQALGALTTKLVEHDKQATEIKSDVCAIKEQLKEMRSN